MSSRRNDPQAVRAKGLVRLGRDRISPNKRQKPRRSSRPGSQIEITREGEIVIPTQANAEAPANDTHRWTVIQRDHNGRDVNTITGLCQDDTKAVEDILKSGSAYQGDQPWTLEVQRELTQAEIEEREAELWLTAEGTNQIYFTSTSGLAKAFELLAANLRRMGDQPITKTWLNVSMQVVSHDSGPDGFRRLTAELLAEAFCMQTPTSDENAHYGSRTAQLNVFAPGIAKPECKQTGGPKNPDGTSDIECACGECLMADANIAPEDRAEIMAGHFGEKAEVAS